MAELGKVGVNQRLQAHQLDGVCAGAAVQAGHASQLAHACLGTDHECVATRAAQQGVSAAAANQGACGITRARQHVGRGIARDLHCRDAGAGVDRGDGE